MDYQELLNKQWVRYLGVLLVGITIGALFYPTKRIEERVSAKYEEQISMLNEQHQKESQIYKESIAKLETSSKEYREQSEQKISKLTSEVRDLKSKQKTAYYKIVKPDGTVEIKKFSESEVTESTKVITEIKEEFNKKLESIETKWSNIHRERVTEIKKDFDSKEQQYKSKIAELEASKVTTVNEKRFGLEVGLLTNSSYYGHATMDLWGPTFIGLHGQMDRDSNNKEAGIGIGIRF